jgi:hypothetical protein
VIAAPDVVWLSYADKAQLQSKETQMRRWFGAVVGAGFLLLGAPSAYSADEELSACFDAVGTFLTTNINPEDGADVGRSLISLTNGGHFFLTDSNEGGEAGFAPFTEGRGAWRCVSDESGELHILATVLDFTHKSDSFPEQKIARLDYDAVYDEESGKLSADVKIYFMPIDANPMDPANLNDPIPNQISGTRVTAQ